MGQCFGKRKNKERAEDEEAYANQPTNEEADNALWIEKYTRLADGASLREDYTLLGNSGTKEATNERDEYKCDPVDVTDGRTKTNITQKSTEFSSGEDIFEIVSESDRNHGSRRKLLTRMKRSGLITYQSQSANFKADKYEAMWGAVQQAGHPQAGPSQEGSSPSMEDIIKEEKMKKQEEKKNTQSLLKRNRVLVGKNVKMIREILSQNVSKKINSNASYTRNTLAEDSKQHNFVKSKFDNKKFTEKFQINKIEFIWNPYIFAQYELKKEYSKEPCKERHLYHGTEIRHLDSILRYNFDWRKTKNSKYGRGISFATNAWYASHYSTRNQRGDEEYVMILAKVLIGKKCRGKKDLSFPEENCDTTTNDDGQVLVKYDDACCYPEFVIYFDEK